MVLRDLRIKNYFCWLPRGPLSRQHINNIALLALFTTLNFMKTTFFQSLSTKERIYYFSAAALAGTLAVGIGGLAGLILTLDLWSY